jgi:hypothetical protein
MEARMHITDILGQIGGIEAIASELGITIPQAESGVSALVPPILGGFKKQAQTRADGTTGLGNFLGKLGGDGLLDEVLAPRPTSISRGNDILGAIFGSKDVSRTVAQNAAEQTGLAPEVLKKMLPLLAMLVAGYMAGQRRGPERVPPGGGLAALLGGRPDGSSPQPGESEGLAGLLELSREGNALDDILAQAGGARH